MSSRIVRGWILTAGFILLLGSACKGGDESKDGASSSSEKAQASGDKDSTPDAIDRTLAEGMAIPQEELITSPRAVKISGIVTVEGYSQGQIQIDVLRDKRGPQRPVTTARFPKPGAYEIYVPSGLGPLMLNAILDIDSDGPSMSDPTGGHGKGTIEPKDSPLTGIDLIIDITNIQRPPPQNQPAQPNKEGSKDEGGESLNIDDSEDSEIILKSAGD